MKKSVKVGKRIVDIDFEKDQIIISVWKVNEMLPLGYEYL